MIRRSNCIRLNETQRELMRAAGRFNAELMDQVRRIIRPGVSTDEINSLVHDYTLDHGHTPACLGYPGDKIPFPKSCCTSINDVICHGIPGEYELRDGDIINVDLSTAVNGWYGDQSETFLIGQCTSEAIRVVQCAFDCLNLSIDAISPGCRVSVIGETIVQHAEQFGYGVVEKYVGHGIGEKFHQLPNIPHVPSPQARQERLMPGMCFTIEPMINAGTPHTVCDRKDGWTVYTRDRKISAQFEHTILMTEDGPEILTPTQNGPRPGHQFSNEN